jgi:hypothetical protein
MKTHFRIISVIFFSVLLITSACNNMQQDNYENNNLKSRQDGLQALETLQGDLKKYESEIDATLADRPTNFRELMYISLDSSGRGSTSSTSG